MTKSDRCWLMFGINGHCAESLRKFNTFAQKSNPRHAKVKLEALTRSPLQFVLSEGEGLFVEFKERPDKSLAQEMVAFANTSGGRIFIGVSDDSQAVGIQIDNRLKSQIEDTARNCDPPVAVKVTALGRILVVEVPESMNKPHACSDGFFMRIGANSQKLSRDEVFSMGIRSGRLRFDEQVCGPFDYLCDVDEEKVSAYLRAAELNATLPLTEILTNLEVLNSENGKPVMTNAGVLLFAKNPQRFLKSSPVVCAVYQGDDKVHVLDRKIFNDGLIGNIDAAVTYLKRHVDVRFEIRSVRREEISQYPEAAFREAIVNAVMHRDYFDASGDIMVEVFQNRLTISNPGGLVPWLPPEDFGKYSRTRNRLIASLLMRTHQAEKMGTGIRRIRRTLEAAGQPPAQFDYDDYNFSVTLFSSLRVEQGGALSGALNGALNEEVPCLLDLIQKNPNIQRREIVEKLGIPERTADRHLAELVSRGKIERRGSKKTGGYWPL